MILAFGDSLTNGFGVSSKHSYPKQIQNKMNLEVLNGGIDGEFSSEAILRLSSLLKYKPSLVILCHGANDILNKYSSNELKKNLLIMIQIIKDSGAEQLFVGVPDYYLDGFETHKLYKEVARETGILFEDGVMTHIALNNSLRNDDVHPNEKGYKMMADAFIKILKISITGEK